MRIVTRSGGVTDGGLSRSVAARRSHAVGAANDNRPTMRWRVTQLLALAGLVALCGVIAYLLGG